MVCGSRVSDVDLPHCIPSKLYISDLFPEEFDKQMTSGNIITNHIFKIK
jgi:hypothetical protein